MKVKIEANGTMLVRLDPVDDCIFYAQMVEQTRAARNGQPLRYAFNPSEPRDEDGQWTAGGAMKKKEPIKVDPKEVEKHPYHSMTSFPMFADTPAKKKTLEDHAAKELKEWREAATKRVDMGTGERQQHNKVLDPLFKALKAAFLKTEAPTWKVASKRAAAETPEVEIPKKAKKNLAAVKEKIKSKKVSVPKVKAAVKAAATKKGKQTADQLAKETATKLESLQTTWVEMAKKNADRMSKIAPFGADRKKGMEKTPMPENMDAEIDELIGKASVHKIAKLMGFMKQKNSEQARKMIHVNINNRVWSIVRDVI